MTMKIAYQKSQILVYRVSNHSFAHKTFTNHVVICLLKYLSQYYQLTFEPLRARFRHLHRN